MQDHRKFLRVDICTEVEYQILPLNSVFKSRTKNISRNGLCFLTKDELKVGTLLLLKFYLPDKEKTQIECVGRVIWQKKADNTGYFTGVEFRDLDVEKELKILLFILQYLKEIEEY